VFDHAVAVVLAGENNHASGGGLGRHESGLPVRAGLNGHVRYGVIVYCRDRIW
jgi:hypothetical protein